MSEPITPDDVRGPGCYRHPATEAAVGCQRCGRPICPSCMITASVGFQCPDCTRQGGQRVVQPLQRTGRAIPLVLQVAMAMIGVAYLGQQASTAVTNDGLLFGPAVAAGEWWRVVTSGFLHSGLLHLGFNLYAIYLFGQLFRRGPGEVPVGLIYLGGLFGGAAAVLAFDFGSPTLGASGAVLGLAGGAAVFMQRNGIPFLQSAAGQIILLNLALPLLVGGISFWGHAGGAAGGALVAAALLAAPGAPPQRWAVAGGVVAALAAASIAVAGLGGLV